MKYILAFVLAVFIVMLAVNMVSEGVLSDGAAVATRVEGTVRIITSEAPGGRLLVNNDRIAKNDRVEVQENSKLELRLPDGGFVRLSENTRLTMRKLQFEQKTGALYLHAFLHNGKLWAKINKRTSPDSWVQVSTNTGLATGKDAVYGVDAEEDANTTINVYEGIVLAESAATIAPRTDGPSSAPEEVQQAGLQAMQQVAIPAQESALEARDFDLKTMINDWVRWNLQRDAREGLAIITIAPAAPASTRGGFLQFSAVAHYPDNAEKDITSFATWSTSSVNVAKIDPYGLAEGANLGATRVVAAIEDINGSAVLNIGLDLVSIKVTRAASSIANGAMQQFTAIGTFSDKSVKDITSSVSWSSSKPAVAFVDATGRAVGGNVMGSTVISASLGTKRGSATLKVSRKLVSITIMPKTSIIGPGDMQRYGAVGSYSDKTTQDLTELVEWQSSDIRIAVMEEVLPGRLLGQKSGTATIKAIFKNISGSATILVK